MRFYRSLPLIPLERGIPNHILTHYYLLFRFYLFYRSIVFLLISSSCTRESRLLFYKFLFSQEFRTKASSLFPDSTLLLFCNFHPTSFSTISTVSTLLIAPLAFFPLDSSRERDPLNSVFHYPLYPLWKGNSKFYSCISTCTAVSVVSTNSTFLPLHRPYHSIISIVSTVIYSLSYNSSQRPLIFELEFTKESYALLFFQRTSQMVDTNNNSDRPQLYSSDFTAYPEWYRGG